MAENNVVWMKIAEIAHYKSIAFDADFFATKNIENFVLMIEEIWQNDKNLDIFWIFKKFLKEIFSENFDFINDFKDCIYSHS